MHHTVDYIINKPNDFKRCIRCGQINWYENEYCSNCYYNRFVKLTDKDIQHLLEVYPCDECEIDT
jgi:ribosomal protein L37E